MLRPSAEPRASPVVMPEELRQLIRETYKETDKRLAIMTMIERHLDHLNALDLTDRAQEFLTNEEQSIREDAKRLSAERRRAALRLVVRTTIPAAIVLAAKYIATKFGLAF
jgi:hypothetical protein